ncbi:hypothetical protein COCCU_10115 [Corynebacterium occultum]|uniref:Telomeric repeat-binding factor 2 n=1 Tax=Corynebacterium occultum TaxID=2675219 RepID=A0A6B8VQW1_9CORY|nr:hypothetical protein [Corynebacterium occultum]QGU07942.1 hypothetical protein COCCU_10115 [Corynebacterium occultum]
MKLNRLLATATASSLLFLIGCSSEEDPTGAEGLDASSTAAAQQTFEPTPADPISTDDLSETLVDPGLNVEWTMYGASVAPMTGDVVIHVRMKNLNDVPVPPDVIEGPTLYVNNNGTRTEIDRVSDDTTEMSTGLDLPLGVGATTNLQYVFDTTTGMIWDAEFQIGNVTFEGDLFF